MSSLPFVKSITPYIFNNWVNDNIAELPYLIGATGSEGPAGETGPAGDAGPPGSDGIPYALSASVQTTNAAATTLITFTPSGSNKYFGEGIILTKNTDEIFNGYKFNFTYYLGTITFSPLNILSSEINQNIPLPILTKSGSNVLLQVIGIGSETWDWLCKYNIFIM